jgi:adenine-specific DNA-methyltransferase
MGKVRYIGSKVRVVDEILEVVGPPGPDDGAFVDAFCGTGVVGARAADLGWPVRFNDSLRSAVAVSVARLVSAADVPFANLDGYAGAIDRLNRAAPVEGFFWREYSPAGPTSRRYFTVENAARIDAVRTLLKGWRSTGLIGRDEHELLIADLISAAARVANIAGTYGCFLNGWTAAAKRRFTMQSRELHPGDARHEAHCGDVVDTPMAVNDVVYFDPPYTKRQYAAYYHINETLACEDEPDVVGKTGLRPWREKASDYCYKSRALDALSSLVANTPASRVFLSYGSEGHVALEDLREALRPLGDVAVHELGPIGRYRPNSAASAAASDVTEYVVELVKSSVGVVAVMSA